MKGQTLQREAFYFLKGTQHKLFRLACCCGGNQQNKLQPLHFEFLSHHCHHTFLASLPPPVTSTFVAGIGIALVWITRLQLKISPLSNWFLVWVTDRRWLNPNPPQHLPLWACLELLTRAVKVLSTRSAPAFHSVYAGSPVRLQQVHVARHSDAFALE